MLRKTLLAFAAALLGGTGVAAALVLPATADHGSPKQGRIGICHATGSRSNPFVYIAPDASGVWSGHIQHQDGRDIIPAFSFTDAHGALVAFPGQNLTTVYNGVTGALLLAHHCQQTSPATTAATTVTQPALTVTVTQPAETVTSTVTVAGPTRTVVRRRIVVRSKPCLHRPRRHHHRRLRPPFTG